MSDEIERVAEYLRSNMSWRNEKAGTYAAEREAPRPRPTTAQREAFFARIAEERKRAEAS